MRIIIEETETTSGKLFNLAIQFLVLCSVISFSLETLPNLHPSMIVILNRVEVFIILIFSVEYLARIWVSKNSLKYVFSFYGIIDLLSILPFYLALAVDLRILRIFRFLRLFRILKIAKFIRAIDRFYEALKIAKEEIFLFLFATALVIYLSAAGIYFFENIDGELEVNDIISLENTKKIKYLGLNLSDDIVFLKNDNEFYNFDDNYLLKLVNEKDKDKDIKWSNVSKINKKLAKYYLSIHQGEGVSLTRILTELHNGKFFGSIFTLILFFSSLSLIFLTLSSFIFATNIFKNKKR